MRPTGDAPAGSEPLCRQASGTWRLAPSLGPRTFALTLGAAALIAFGALAALLPRLPLRHGPAYYHQGAVNILRGEGYVVRFPPDYPGPRVRRAFWPPGYSAFLAAVYAVVGPREGAALAALAVALTYAVARAIVREGTSRLAALLFLALALTTKMSRDAYPEALFTCLVLLALWAALGRRGLWWQVAAGLALGLAHLVRPVALLLPAVLPVVLRLLGRSWRSSALAGAVVLAVSLSVVAPWTVRNWLLFGRFVLISTNGGENLWKGNNPQATGALMDPPMTPELSAAQDEVDWDAAARRQAIAFVRSNPLKLPGLALGKLYHTCGFGMVRWAAQRGGGGLELAATAALAWATALVLALCAAQFAWAAARVASEGSAAWGWALVPPLLGGYFLAFPLVFFGLRRFIYPGYPFYALSLVVLGDWVGSAIRARRLGLAPSGAAPVCGRSGS